LLIIAFCSYNDNHNVRLRLKDLIMTDVKPLSLADKFILKLREQLEQLARLNQPTPEPVRVPVPVRQPRRPRRDTPYR
jgi:hypothetical protein